MYSCICIWKVRYLSLDVSPDASQLHPFVFLNVPTVLSCLLYHNIDHLNVLSSYSTRAAPSLRDRSSLFGSTPVSSGSSSHFGGIYPQARQQSNGHRYADDLEGQNDEAIEGLSAKVKLLKDVSEFFLILFSWFQSSQSILFFLALFF